MKKYIANIVTGCRIFGSVLLLFFPAFSVEFYVLYVICGFSDMIDGSIARLTNSSSEFGSKIDTAADITFIAVSLVKILPTINIPLWFWIWCALIAIIKFGNVILGYVFIKQFIAMHTIMNKITGALMFLLPLTLPFTELKYSLVVVCTIAMFSAIQECVFVVTNCKNK